MSLYAAVILRRTWSEVPRLPCLCWESPLGGSYGMPFSGTRLDLRRSRGGSACGARVVIATVDSDYGLGAGRLLLRGR